MKKILFIIVVILYLIGSYDLHANASENPVPFRLRGDQ